MRRFLLCVALVLSFVLVLVLASMRTLAQSSPTSALINEQLEKPVNLDLDTTLPEAMKAIARMTGVRIEASPAVWELLPWGDQTKVTAKAKNIALKDALTAITRKLGLEWTLKDEAVELRPMPALMRLGRRATAMELEALDYLASTPANLGTEKPTVRQLIETVDQRLEQQKKDFAVESRPGDNVTQDQPVVVPRTATLMQALEALQKDTRATWYPWGKSIVIVPKEDQIRNQLSKTVTVRYPGTDVMQVLTELSQKAGVPFEIEPGAIQRIAPEARRIKLDLYDASILRALEAIAGFTGLGYVVNEKGVYIWNAASNPAATARDPVIGTVQLDNGMSVMIRESQVPPDMQEYIRLRTRRELDKVRQMMKDEGFKPSAPATQPGAAAPKPTTKADDDL
jgi:hypothetical protein